MNIFDMEKMENEFMWNTIKFRNQLLMHLFRRKIRDFLKILELTSWDWRALGFIISQGNAARFREPQRFLSSLLKIRF